ncbi:hypothetical protein NDS46_03935 [Paenibacillus thiaminolyticus]|uniref:hypothetical protein n=1 Tax=Paenibacillus thiaminolyticus TaxID=49283 RepID=UPI00232E3680|nr:hypothetical protein [Paenibacillus thiaminolyticus]WCF09071.1 hypothetical protein NDS46_03935 [Paenibacillus thiaminolyticus]
MELCGLINERVIDDVFRVHGAAPAELLANWRDVCDMFRFSDAQTYVNVSLICTYFSEAFKQYTDDSFVNDVKKVRLEEAKRTFDGRQNCGQQPPGLRACQAI